MTEDVKAFPTSSGTHVAYQVEHKLGSDVWKPLIPIEGRPGIPMSGFAKGINLQLGMFNHEAAMALAWWALAEARAQHQFDYLVRVVPYKIQYDLKAFIDADHIETIGAAEVSDA